MTMNRITKDERDIQRKLKVLHHAEKSGHMAKTCRYFGVGRSSFYRWKAAYAQHGEAGLNAQPIPKHPANQTPPEIVEGPLPAQQIPPRFNQSVVHSRLVSMPSWHLFELKRPGFFGGSYQ